MSVPGGGSGLTANIAQYNLGDIHHKGWEVAQDLVLAYMWLGIPRNAMDRDRLAVAALLTDESIGKTIAIVLGATPQEILSIPMGIT